MMVEDPLAELWQIKRQLAERFKSVSEIAREAGRLAKEEPLAAAGKHRKLIEGIPRGQSVGDPDPELQALWQTKESLSHELSGAGGASASAQGRRARKGKAKAAKGPAFRGSSLKGRSKLGGNSDAP